MRTIRVAIAGVGNCASSLLQGLAYYRDADPQDSVPGLMHVTLGGYHVRDVEVVAAFDVDAAKVGLDVSKAIFAGHRISPRLFEDRGLAVDRTYQLNFGGNMDFKNMLERERLQSKKISKTQAVTSQLDEALPADDVHVGPSDHVPWLEDRKWAYIRIEGRNFGDVPLNLELKLEVWDSPNSAGVITDAVRCAKLPPDRGIGGPLLGPSAYFMKSPPEQYADDQARQMVDDFANG